MTTEALPAITLDSAFWVFSDDKTQKTQVTLSEDGKNWSTQVDGKLFVVRNIEATAGRDLKYSGRGIITEFVHVLLNFKAESNRLRRLADNTMSAVWEWAEDLQEEKQPGHLRVSLNGGQMAKLGLDPMYRRHLPYVKSS